MGRSVIVSVVLGLGLGLVARVASGEPAAPSAALDPDTAQLISIGVTAAGLGYSAYLWQHGTTLEEGHGRAEHQLYSLATATLTIGAGPMSGLLLGGERKRAIVGGVARPALLVVGGLGAVTGALVVGFGCFETDDCAAAKVTGGIMMGAGAATGAAAIAWAAHDLWRTPRLLRAHRRTRVQLTPLVGRDRVGLAVTLR